MKLGKMYRSVLLLTAVAAIALTGCSPKVTRSADVSTGDYYTAEEFKNLSREQRDTYCAALDAELAKVDGAKGKAAGDADAAKGELGKLQGDLKKLQADYDGAKAENDGIQKDIDYFEGLPKMHVVEKGEFLQKISQYEKIYADPTKWPRIYRANKDKIKDPNLIYPGWELVIPRDWPSTWVVKDGEYLSKIAGYWEVYGKSTDWPKIHEANKDKVKDPNLIHPKWELKIPR